MKGRAHLYQFLQVQCNISVTVHRKNKRNLEKHSIENCILTIFSCNGLLNSLFPNVKVEIFRKRTYFSKEVNVVLMSNNHFVSHKNNSSKHFSHNISPMYQTTLML